MFYRIQTLYLLFTLVIAFFLAFYDFQIFVKAPEWVRISLLKKYFFSFSGALSFLTLLSFRKRRLQLKLNVFNILINIASFIFIFFYFLSQGPLLFFVYLIFVFIVLIILFLLASRAIDNDEFLVKSADRIR